MTPQNGNETPSISTNLLVQIQNMDGEGWARFVGIFAPIVYAWCRKAGISQSDAPDLVQDVFATVARQAHRFSKRTAEDSFRSWLATITRCRVIDHFRKCCKQPAGTGGTDAMHLLQQTPAELESSIASSIAWPHAEGWLIGRIMRDVECEFEAVTWNAFWQTTIDSRPAADVSAELGISVASVYQAKSRVLRRVRKLLEEVP